MTIREWLISHKEEYTDRAKWVKACAKVLKANPKSVRNIAIDIWPSAQIHRRPKNNNRMNRKAFKSQYDEATKIREAIRSGIEKLMKSPDPESDEIIKDSEFRIDYCDCNYISGWKRISEEDEFAKYRFRVGSNCFWSTPRTVEWAVNNVSKARRI